MERAVASGSSGSSAEMPSITIGAAGCLSGVCWSPLAADASGAPRPMTTRMSPRTRFIDLGDEEEDERDGNAGGEDAQSYERNLASQFCEHASRFRPRQNCGGNEDRAKEQQPHCEQRKKNEQEDPRTGLRARDPVGGRWQTSSYGPVSNGLRGAGAAHLRHTDVPHASSSRGRS